MPRRSAGFVSKKPHKKSRGGCSTCKRKKVKCDELLPICTYCSLRRLECTYPKEFKTSPSPSDPEDVDFSLLTRQQDDVANFNDTSVHIRSLLTPAVNTSSGQLSAIELEFLHHYKTVVWPSMSFRQDETVHSINRDWVPQMALSREYLLYSILSIAAAHSVRFQPNSPGKNLWLLYQQRAFKAYSEALTNITSDKYETLLITATYMMTMVPPPELPCTDAACLTWISALMNMMQGVRVLASLKWAQGIEKLTIFPIFRRELRKLPPPPSLSNYNDARYYPNARASGDDPTMPNPPQTYVTPPATPPSAPMQKSAAMDMSNLPFRPQQLMSAGDSPHSPQSWKRSASWQVPSPAFLPPTLMALLKPLVADSDDDLIDVHRPTLVPALHAFSPIFLSLYYYRLNPDLFVRIFVLPTFLTPEFFALVKSNEPRALIIMGWWFAFVGLIPNLWWLDGTIPRVLQAISNEVMRCNNKVYMDAMEGAYRVARLVVRKGREAAAQSVFDGWEGVSWWEGPRKEEEWRFEELVELGT